MPPANCPFFDTRPKTDRQTFFGRDTELEEASKLVQGGFWPIVLGPRRVGKTSLLKIVTRENKGIYIDASTIESVRGLGRRLLEETRKLRIKLTVDFKILRVELEKNAVATMENMLKELDTLIAIDEVQNIKSNTLAPLLSVAYNESRVKFMFSGSLIGLSKMILKSPQTLGRPIVKLEIQPFDQKKSIEFLRQASTACGTPLKEEEILDAVDTFDGIVGWLTYYGNFRSLGYPHHKALNSISTIARTIVQEELAKLSKNQLKVYRALAQIQQAEWSEIKRLVDKTAGPIDDKTFSKALQTLVDMYLARKNGKQYEIVDKYMAKITATTD